MRQKKCSDLSGTLCSLIISEPVYLGSVPLWLKMFTLREITWTWFQYPSGLNKKETWNNAQTAWGCQQYPSGSGAMTTLAEEREPVPKCSLRIFKHNWQLSLIIVATCFSTTMVTFITYTFNADTKHSAYDKHSAQMAGWSASTGKWTIMFGLIITVTLAVSSR